MKTPKLTTLMLLLILVVTAPTYALEVLVPGGNIEPKNRALQALKSFPKVAGEAIQYTTTKDRTLSKPQLDV